MNKQEFSIDTIEQESDTEINQFLEESPTSIMKEIWDALHTRVEEEEDEYYHYGV